MLEITDKALSYVKGKKLCFVVSVENTAVECDCSNCHTNIKTLKTKVLFETEVLDKEDYDIYEYKSVKVFILNQLKIASNITIYQKAKIPFIQPRFGTKGITA